MRGVCLKRKRMTSLRKNEVANRVKGPHFILIPGEGGRGQKKKKRLSGKPCTFIRLERKRGLVKNRKSLKKRERTNTQL